MIIIKDLTAHNEAAEKVCFNVFGSLLSGLHRQNQNSLYFTPFRWYKEIGR
jgi:hemerythrin superfamily protein